MRASCPILWDCSPPGSSVLGILQARILEWLAIPFSRESSQPRGQTQISCIAGWFFTVWATREAQFLRLLGLYCYFNDPRYSERGFKVVSWLAFSFLNISLGYSWTWGQLECLFFSFSIHFGPLLHLLSQVLLLGPGLALMWTLMDWGPFWYFSFLEEEGWFYILYFLSKAGDLPRKE